jgi:hypothetical protein
MTRLLRRICGVALRRFPPALAVLSLVLPAWLHGADPAAEELIGRVLANAKTRSLTLRAKLVVADAANDRRSAFQLRMRGRRDGDLVRRLYQVLWPASRQGQALYFERTDEGTLAGFLFVPPDQVTPLTTAELAQPFLDSDLSVEDLAEEFWRWPGQAISGADAIDGEACKIVESHPVPGAETSYGFVRSWVSPPKALPLRIEKFDRDGHLVKWITFGNFVRVDEIWTPRTLTVKRPAATQETTLEIFRGDRDVDIPLAEFSLEAVKNLPRRLAQEAEAAAERGRHSVHK